MGRNSKPIPAAAGGAGVAATYAITTAAITNVVEEVVGIPFYDPGLIVNWGLILGVVIYIVSIVADLRSWFEVPDGPAPDQPMWFYGTDQPTSPDALAGFGLDAATEREILDEVDAASIRPPTMPER